MRGIVLMQSIKTCTRKANTKQLSKPKGLREGGGHLLVNKSSVSRRRWYLRPVEGDVKTPIIYAVPMLTNEPGFENRRMIAEGLEHQRWKN